MSQIVSIQRKISKKEIAEACKDSKDFDLGEEYDWGIVLKFTAAPEEHIVFINGEIQSTSPSQELFEKLEDLANKLGANLVLEDEEQYVPSSTTGGGGYDINLFWVMAFIILLVLLFWKW